MNKKLIKILSPLFVLVFLLSACSESKELEENTSDSDKTQIVSSIFPVYEMVKEVAGDQAEVHLMVGSGEDAHHYEPSAKAISLVNESDAFIYSCEEMEFWASDMLEVVENEDLSVMRLSDDLDLEIEEDHLAENDDSHNHDHGSIDPHYWLNPLAMSKQIPKLIELLSDIDPSGEDIYQKNGEQIILELEKLDQEFEDSFSDAKNRSFIVQHQAFGHLANRYHLEQKSVGGLSTEVEANPKDMIDIINFVNENEIEVIFYQSGNTSAVAETIARETGSEIAILYDLENKPEAIEDADNYYLEAMYHNLEVLKKAIN